MLRIQTEMLSIFVVDDQRIIADTLAIILKHNQFDARAFDDPQDALEAAALSPPHLLISDVAMPTMTGLELAVHFRVRYPRCKVLLFSGQANTRTLLDDARALGYDFEILNKPIHPEDLINKISLSGLSHLPN